MFRVYSILMTGILIVSIGSLIIRWTGEVPAAVIAFYRVFISSLILTVYAINRPVKPLTTAYRNLHWHYFLAGTFLAVHFISWIASLQMTTIANSIFLVSTHPLFAVIFSILLLREYPTAKTIGAFPLALIGMYLIVSQDMGSMDTYVLGDLLAVLSAVSFAAYLLIARLHRSQDDFIGYLVVVYGTAAIVCAIFNLLTGNRFTGYSATAWIMMALLALGPHLAGDSILNWCSRQIAVFKVNMALSLEPVVATTGGMIFFQEYPQPVFYYGAACILAAIIYLLLLEKRTRQNIST